MSATNQPGQEVIPLATIPEERHVCFLLPARDAFGSILPPRQVFPFVPSIRRKRQLMVIARPGSPQVDRISATDEQALWRQHRLRYILPVLHPDKAETTGKKPFVIAKIPDKRSVVMQKVMGVTEVLFKKGGRRRKCLARLALKPRPRRQDPRREAKVTLYGTKSVRYTRSPSPFPRSASRPSGSLKKPVNKAPKKPIMKRANAKMPNKETPKPPAKKTIKGQ